MIKKVKQEIAIKEEKKDIKENIIFKNISEYSEIAYLEYAMSVVKGRAIPSVEDGLKPVHRRILYAMFREGMIHSSVHKKSARVVGNVLGLYHPHGDQSVYEAMVRQAQNFSVRYPLIDGQGNFGSRDGDGAASMRYCFAPETRIMTEKGLLRIIDIVEDYSNKSIENIDLKVNSLDKPEKAIKWLYSGEHKTLNIKTNKGFDVTCTPNEPFYVLNKDLNFVWKKAEDIKFGDRISIKTTNELNILSNKDLILSEKFKNNASYPQKMSKNLAKFLGYLLSCGSLRLNGTTVEFGNSNIEIFNDFKKCFEELFKNFKTKDRIVYPESTVNKKIKSKLIHYYFNCNSTELVNFLKELDICPLLSKNKIIPKIIYESSKEEVSSFLSAYFEGEGAVSIADKKLMVSLSSTSISILDGVKQLLLNYFGIISNQICLDKIDKNNSYRIQITSNEDILLFKDNVGFISTNKINKLNFIKQNKSSSCGFKKNYIPNLGSYLNKYFKEKEISNKYIYDEFGNKFLKENLLKTLKLSRFTQIKTEFKLKYYLNDWTDIGISSFPKLFNKLKDIINKKYFYDIIKTVTLNKEVQKVYDLTVENTHAFIANGFIAHNTEAKLAPITQMYLEEIKDQCVDFLPNYDGSEMEPKFLPARLPFILLNGNPGIAVGMATDIPGHNIKEVIGATIEYLENDKVTLDKLLEYIKGPDFVTGGQIISSAEEIKKIYSEGRGSIRVRSKYKFEEDGKNWKLVFYEIPHTTSVKKIMEEIDGLFNPEDKMKKDAKGNVKKISPEQLRLKTIYSSLISKYTDASDKDNPVRLVIEPKNNKQDRDELVNTLLGYTSLECNIATNFVMVGRDGRPVQKNLMEILGEWISFRLETIERRVKYHLQKIAERLHILEGRQIILNHIDEVIRIIKNSENPKEDLMKRFNISEIQAQDVLELRLRQIGRLELESILKEIAELTKRQAELNKIISSQKNLKKQAVKELNEDLQKFSDERITEITYAEKIDTATLNEKTSRITEEDVTLAISSKGWVKSLKGKKAIEDISFKEGDKVDYIYECKNTDTLAIFDIDGKVYNYPINELNKDGVPINTLAQFVSKVSIAFPINKDHKYILSQDSGYGFIVSGENLLTKMKAGKEMITIAENGNILKPESFLLLEEFDKLKVAILTTDNKLLCFKLSEISEIGKGKGVVLLDKLNNKIKQIKLIKTSEVDFIIETTKGKKEIILNKDELIKYTKKRATKGTLIQIKDKFTEILFK